MGCLARKNNREIHLVRQRHGETDHTRLYKSIEKADIGLDSGDEDIN